MPDAYLPPGRRPSLDLLADVMTTLPVPGPLPTGKGAVVAVVGAVLTFLALHAPTDR